MPEGKAACRVGSRAAAILRSGAAAHAIEAKIAPLVEALHREVPGVPS